MKKIIYIILFLILSTTVLANSEEHEFNVKFGTSVPLFMEENRPGNASFDFAYSFNIGIVKYFAVGFESGINWVSWQSYTGSQRYSGTAGFQKKDTNAYSIPFFVNFLVRFDKRERWYVMPYILSGLGYGFNFFVHPDSQETYRGFTWQLLAGLAFRLGEARNIELLVEFGYRGAQYKESNDYELDMSGMIFHAGLRFPFRVDE